VRIGVILLVLMGILAAEDDIHENIKRSLRPNMVVLYDELPGDVDTLDAMFTQGKFYGRVRFNSFGFKWKNELEVNGVPVRKDQAIAALGGSLIYKSAYLNGFGVGAGLYVTEALGTLPKDEAYLYKAGKDTISRYDQLTDGSDGILSLAQAYLEYKYEKTRVKAGRQIFESFLTRSNDTKMIPNTFEGVTLMTKDIPKTMFKAAYLTKQKLRDHSGFHHVLAYGYVPGAPVDAYTQYTENDDAAMHKGLTLSRLKEAGIDDRLLVLEMKTQSIKGVKLTANYTAVPELLSSAMVQADLSFEVGEWSVLPGLRYMKQFDNGAGAIGGASIKGRKFTLGYKDPWSLDSWLVGVRTDIVNDGLKFRFGYTQIADEGDIVAPWRGFPTGGFTRVMGQYNWYANTKSYMFQVDYHLEDFESLLILGRFAYQDFDDEKLAVPADSKVFTLDIMKGFDGTSNMYVKMRYGHVWGKPQTGAIKKLDPSYDELRLEVNYLF
jgi:hypothetical protein